MLRANFITRGRSSSLAPFRQSIQLQKQLISIDQTTRSRKVYRHVTRAPQSTSTLSSQPTDGSKRQPLPADTIIPKQKKIVFCVDGTKSAEDALRWMSKNLAMKGDTIHLAHVIADPSGIATQYNANSTAERRLSQEVFLRLEHEASLMMQTRFIPPLQFTGINHTIEIIKLKVDKSAGAIGEALAAKATALDADLLVIASHGAGVMADFGSVARWCSEHSTVPVVLIPSAIMKNADAPAGNTLIIGASDSLETLRQAFEFVTSQLARPGDAIMLFNVIAPCSEETAIEARKQLVLSASQWQEEQSINNPLAKTINIGCDVLSDYPVGGAMGSAAALGHHSSFEDTGCPAGEKMVMYAEDMNARVVVFGHHGRGSMMREVVWGPLTAHITRHCAKPLVVWNPQNKVYK